MALFAIQLVRVVITSLVDQELAGEVPLSLTLALDVVIFIHQMLNVIIRSVYFLFILFLLKTNFTWLLGHRTNDNFGAGLNETILR